MKTWTPLWSSIVDSSVWGETKETKILWITILAKKDRNGFVEASLPGLARAAVLTLAETEKAIKVLEYPDPHSRSKANEGRRIKKVEGGWTVLNHFPYRDEMSSQYRREYQRQKQAEYRSKKKNPQPLKGEVSYLKGVKREDDQQHLDHLTDPDVLRENPG